LIAVFSFFGCSRAKNDVSHTTPAAATNAFVERGIRQRCPVKDSTDVVTFFSDGSVELTSDGKTVAGSIRPAMPEAAELSFPGTTPKAPSRTIWASKRYDRNAPLGYVSNWTDLVYVTR